MKIRRNAKPSQLWQVTLNSKAPVKGYAHTPQGVNEDNYALAIQQVRARCKDGGQYDAVEVKQIPKLNRMKQIWLLDGKPAPTKCKGAYPRHVEKLFTA